ncbi:MAG: cytochrome c oxidase subunit II [Gemmatimonadota bacterium]
MVGTFRPRRMVSVALLGALALGLAACGGEYPNSTFNPNTEYNAAIDSLWDKLLFLGTIVFIVTEIGLIYTIIRFRRQPGGGTPKQVHGNTALEITWTAIPAVILIFVAVPTVRTIFKTQAKAAPDALQVEVIGHQWWWEFRYPQYGITTANELYIPNGRTVNFSLKTADVLHSFWIPQMGGKRDLISNKTNYVWFTPNPDLGTQAWNGFCAEFCGPSHANMRFRTYTVTPAEFAQWTAHQKNIAMFPASSGDAAAPSTVPAVAPVPSGAGSAPLQRDSGQRVQPQAKPELSNQAPQTAPLPSNAPQPQAPVWTFPADKLPPHVIPNTPLPVGLAYDDALLAQGDAARGQATYSKSSCIGCHAIAGNRSSMGIIGPNLTHFGTRHTLAAGLYPNDAKHLARWIKNAPLMKPGSIMPTLGKGLTDPKSKMVVNVGGLTDADIADIVAYLQALK